MLQGLAQTPKLYRYEAEENLQWHIVGSHGLVYRL